MILRIPFLKSNLFEIAEGSVPFGFFKVGSSMTGSRTARVDGRFHSLVTTLYYAFPFGCIVTVKEDDRLKYEEWFSTYEKAQKGFRIAEDKYYKATKIFGDK